MTLEKATFADADSIRALYASVIGSAFCVWNDEYPGEEEIRNDISHETLYVFRDEHKAIISALSVEPLSELDDQPFWTPARQPREIARVVVSPDHQGHSLARKMVEQIESILAAQGCDMIRLLVAVVNIPAQKTYFGRGFVKVGQCDLYESTYFACEKKL